MLVVVVISLIVVGTGVVVVILVVGKGVVVEVLGATVAVFSKKPVSLWRDCCEYGGKDPLRLHIWTRGDSQLLKLWWVFNAIRLTEELVVAAIRLAFTVAVRLVTSSKDGEEGDGNRRR